MTRPGTVPRLKAMNSIRRAGGTLTFVGLLLSASPALAHHVMGGGLPMTWLDGALSGLAHPFIGLDHLAFMLAASLLVIRQRLAPLMLAVFVVASTAGVLLHAALFNIPAVEPMIAVSVLLLGLGVAIAKPIGGASLTVLLAAGGIFHGYAFGESIVGAQRAPLLAYLLGLAVIQYIIMISALLLARHIGMPKRQLLTYRCAGAAIALLGLAFLGMMAV